MAVKDLDLVAALGVPEESEDAPPEEKSGSNYLASKPPQLRAFLMDAVDPDLSHEERAEALCRALEQGAAKPAAAPDLGAAPAAPPVGAGFEDY